MTIPSLNGNKQGSKRGKNVSGMRRQWRRFARFIARAMPKSLFRRSLIIIIAPMLILQGVVAFVFMERHWQSVTNLLSASVVRDIAGLVHVIETYEQDEDFAQITEIARERFGLRIAFLPLENFPPLKPKPFFSILDTALSEQLADKIEKPFWVDTVGDSKILEIRIRLEENVLRVFVRRKQAYASNTHIFLLWMIGASIVLLSIAILFLRNQIKPIQTLAVAAERFGKGQELSDKLRPRGAAEVRQATLAFILMRDRIERALEQRTAMLAGVSHDLRTVLTRFRLQLAFVPKSSEVDGLLGDVDDMQGMLQAYLDFARGDMGEAASHVDINIVLGRFNAQAERQQKNFDFSFEGNPLIYVRANAFNRLMDNLVLNGLRHSQRVQVQGVHSAHALKIEVHDDGPGIAKEDREKVFKPFVRLDDARNQDESGTGLGLAIARDIVHMHGGKIELDDSPLGGLLVRFTLPL